VAVNEARQQLSAGELLNGRDWSTPVLYMGTRNGRILDFMGQEADRVKQAWQSVQAVTEQSAPASAALADLSKRFQEIEARHRELGLLLQLSNLLRELRDDFSQCTSIVDQAGLNLASLRFNDLKQAWGHAQQNRLISLQVFLEKRPELQSTAKWSRLQKGAQEIKSGLEQVALKASADSIKVFDNELAGAEVLARQQLEEAIKDLVSLSDRTLGRLAIDR